LATGGRIGNGWLIYKILGILLTRLLETNEDSFFTGIRLAKTEPNNSTSSVRIIESERP
jgi:hypothetical protein